MVGSANLTQSGWSTNQEVFSFHKVECAHQADAIRRFFKPLFTPNAFNPGLRFEKNLRKAPSPSDWYFVHTFLGAKCGAVHLSLLGHLLNEPNTKNLVVWSPYFSRDLAGFIERLRGITPCGDLKVHVIPDLVENKQMRTQWSSSLNDQINDRQVRFYSNPVDRDNPSELCHAKVWMTEHKLAIGSWNFTAPGSNIALEKGESGHVNVEAGVIFENQQPLDQILHCPFSAQKDNFMQNSELIEHAFEVADLLPVNLNVLFDWKTLNYHVTAEQVDKSQTLQVHLFAGLSLDSAIPGHTTIMNFRHLLEKHKLSRQLFKEVNQWLSGAGIHLREGTIVDATITEAASSTKNKTKARDPERDPEMHQTQKGKQWFFGLKAHIGVDARTGLTHSLSTTAANVHDITETENLLHGEECFISADSGYRGAQKREELKDIEADWLIAAT